VKTVQLFLNQIYMHVYIHVCKCTQKRIFFFNYSRMPRSNIRDKYLCTHAYVYMHAYTRVRVVYIHPLRIHMHPYAYMHVKNTLFFTYFITSRTISAINRFCSACLASMKRTAVPGAPPLTIGAHVSIRCLYTSVVCMCVCVQVVQV
jgi:hypothetical protein